MSEVLVFSLRLKKSAPVKEFSIPTQRRFASACPGLNRLNRRFSMILSQLNDQSVSFLTVDPMPQMVALGKTSVVMPLIRFKLDNVF